MINIVSKNKEQILRVVDDTSVVQTLPETSADQVLLEDTDGNYNATDVEQAFREVASEIGSIKRDVENAGKVDDVVNADGTSIVENKVAKLEKAVVKEAGKVKNAFSYTVHDKDKGTKVVIAYDGSGACSLDFDIDDFDPVYTSGDDLGVKIKDKGYAKKTDVEAELDKKLDKAGGSITGDLTIGGNFVVNGTTTTVDSTTLQVKDKLIEVAHGNTTKLTSPAGLVAPKYDGANSGALVFDGDGIARVGDVVLDSNGNIDVLNSDLQPLATRDGLVDQNLVIFEAHRQTLVDSGKSVSDFATKEQGATADEAKAKADSNEEMLGKIINGTQVVGKATMVTTSIGSRAITDIFEGDTDKVKNATNADEAAHAAKADQATNSDNATNATTSDKVANKLKVSCQNSAGIETQMEYDGSAAKEVAFDPTDFVGIEMSNGYAVELAPVYLDEQLTETVEGTYTAVRVNSKGVVQAGGRAIAFIDANDDIPADVMINGLIFRKKA